MPLKVRRLWISCLILTAASGATLAQVQKPENTSSSGTAAATTTQTAAQPVAPANTAQQKIARVKAMIAARNFGGAAIELNRIEKEATDDSLRQVARTMLIAVYLEQPDYTRAQTLLEESFKRNKNSRSGIDESYLAIAGQVIKGAQSQLERYKRYGVSATDANLAPEATADLDKWRAMLETIIEQSRKTALEVKQPAEALALLEAAANARSVVARDEYDANRWKNEMNDTRELMANAQTKVEEVETTVPATLIASNQPAAPSVFANATAPKVNLPTAPPVEKTPQVASGQSEILSASNSTANAKPVETAKKSELLINNTTAANKPADSTNTNRQRVVAGESSVAKAQTAENKSEAPAFEKTSAPKSDKNEPVQVGSLVDMATRRVPPTYPAVARTARVTGVVKVEVVLDESGDVADVRNVAGPEMLKRAAIDAVKRWKFKPATRDGQPVKATGFVNFNFTL